MKVPLKSENVPLKDIVIWFANNPRLAYTAATSQADIEKEFDDIGLRQSLVVKGQIVDGAVMKGQPETFPDQVADKYYTLQGSRRTFNLLKLANEGAIDPNSNRVFNTFRAKVYTDLTPSDVAQITDDDGQKRLDRASIFQTMEKLFDAKRTGEEVAMELRIMLDNAYRVDQAKDLSTPALYFKYRKGIIDVAKLAWLAPTVLRDAYFNKLRTGVGYPLNEEVRQMSQIHQKEVSEDKTGKLNRQNPGPKFLEAWNAWQAKVDAAIADGTNLRGKSSAIMGREQIEASLAAIDSRIGKTFLMCILRKNGFNEEFIALADQAAKSLHAGNVADSDKILDEVWAKASAKVAQLNPAV